MGKHILTPSQVDEFRTTIYTHYAEHKRTFLWRQTQDPYHIVVSEVMLQQTQTERVKYKYEEFLDAFETLQSLAEAPLNQLIAVWSGLGYNRRALSLQLLAQRVIEDYGGTIPDDPEVLVTFKGIGPATAASICAFAFNKPTVFIETNIRAVFIQSFFPGTELVRDGDIFPLVEQTLDTTNAREWYYALMDYGVMLKKTHKNPSRKSAHHTIQSAFEGSDRQVRGLILKMLIETPLLKTDLFLESIKREPAKINRILEDLEREGFIRQQGDCYTLS